MTLAAVYARRSTDQRHADEESKSITRQIASARAFADERGWTVSDEHIYSDDAVSGADVRKLVARQQLLDVIRRGAPFHILIVREQSRFSRRDGDEAVAELKAIARAGVEVWFYRDRVRFEFGNFGANIVGYVKAEAAADYRRQIAGWTYDAMKERARKGWVCGGKLFGYTNRRVEGHVERVIHDGEAAVIRDIFARAAAGEGLRAIAKALNAAGACAPRQSWSPGSVREILHRPVYRGLVVWNQSRKRDAEGQQRQHARPRAEWMSIEAEHLRLVDDAVVAAVEARFRTRQAPATLAPPQISGRGIRRHYFLAGFGRCSQCGGNVLAVSRKSSTGRNVRYCCSKYWNNGTTVCSNGLMAEMPAADQAVRDVLRHEVLQPRILDRAIDLAAKAIQQDRRDGSRGDRLAWQLSTLDRELANLAEVAARGGAVPAVLDALAARDTERRRVASELAQVKRSQTDGAVTPTAIRSRLRGLLDGWGRLLDANPAEARSVLDVVLGDRVAVVPEWRTGLQDMVASPTGMETSGKVDFLRKFRAA